MPLKVYTIGHSTRTFDEFLSILKNWKIEKLVDIRSHPGSRRFPHFNKDALQKSLPENEIGYIHLLELGGRRKPKSDSENSAWKNASFRGYADYMSSEAFESGLLKLIDMAEQKNTAIMCAEAVPWRCHRSLVGDALLARGISVMDIFDLKVIKPHKLTSFGKIKGTRVWYPEDPSAVPKKFARQLLS